ncbi:MAG TPA: chemotaxis protein CheX [Planctomycetaceae bacterium]|nr:chemotaxis protein CheX [Planctomycetaceae bacterium]
MMNVEIINPFVIATVALFDKMLQCRLTRGDLAVIPAVQHYHGVTAIIDLTGECNCRVALNLCRPVALSATSQWTGESVSAINADVVDTVGELVNIIAGQARAQLEHLPLQMGLPQVLKTPTHRVEFPNVMRAIHIPFHSEWGLLSVDVGMDSRSLAVEAASADVAPVATA